MPSRKSDVRKSDVGADASQVTAADDSVPSQDAGGGNKSTTEGSGAAGGSGGGSKKGREESDKTTIEDLTLPKSIITRLAKGVLPANTQIQANAILAMSKSTTVFINYLASHANEITMNANKKTIMPADVFKALEEIEFDFLKEPLEAEFAKFNAIQTDKRNNYRQKKAAKPDADMGDTTIEGDTTVADEDEAPRSKKARVEGGGGGEEEWDAADEDDDVRDEEDEEEADGEDGEDGEEDGDGEGEGEGSGDETQDALEDKTREEDVDEALDGDESD